MGYLKTLWQNKIPGVQTGTKVNATNMNKIEQAIYIANNTFDNVSASDSYAITIDGLTDLNEIVGTPITVKFTIANSTAATLNVNSLGAKNIVRATTTALLTGDIPANKIMTLVYDGTSFQLLSQGADVSQATKVETLTNKTITAPKLGSAGFIADANGNEILKTVATVAAAVNEVTVGNAAVGNAPTLEATGNDTNINLNIKSKGTGKVQANGIDIPVIIKGTANIPTTGWVSNVGDNAIKYDLAIAEVASTDWVSVIIDKNYQDTATDAEINPTVNEYAGGITIYANKAPSVAIPIEYKVVK